MPNDKYAELVAQAEKAVASVKDPSLWRALLAWRQNAAAWEQKGGLLQ
jgi:hypothetical protein